MTVEFIRSKEDFSLYRDKWLQFENTVSHKYISYSYTYLSVFWKNFLNVTEKNVVKKELAIAVLLNNGAIEAIFPFCVITRKRKKIFRVKSLEFIGQQFFSYYSDIIANTLCKEQFCFVMDEVYKNYKIDISYLSHITETSQLYKADNSVSYAFNVCYLYDIKKFEDYAQYQETYSSGHKQNIRTSRNRMANDNLIYEEVSAPLEEKDLEKIIDISRSKLKDNKICFYDDAAKYAMAMDLYRSFDAQLISIKLNGKMVAYRTNLLYHNEKFCLDASFDRDYRRYSVGMLSVEFNLKESFKNGYHSHSEGWGKDEYKERFSTGYNTLYTKLIKGNTLLSSFWFKQYQKSLAHANAQLKSN